MIAFRIALMTLSLVLTACASGGVSPSGFDGTPGAEGGVSPDSSADHGTPLEGGNRDLQPPAADKDGDGYCTPGASDPAQNCTSFDDCDDNDKARHPGALETCANEGTDNDCDQQINDVDEDNDGIDDLQTACDTGLPGVCQPGTRQCSGGKLICAGSFQVGQKSEACNGDDDDCDGKVDEGSLCSSGHTCAGASGCAPCNPSTNLALSATASSSGGGFSAGQTPAELNNGQLESSCEFHWVTATSNPNGNWVQYVWAQPVTLSQIWFDTAPSAGVCNMSAGRSLAGGTVQVWSGSTWTGVGSVAGKGNDWSFSFAKVTTTKLRLYDLVAINSGYAQNPIIFEWRVFCQ